MRLSLFSGALAFLLLALTACASKTPQLPFVGRSAPKSISGTLILDRDKESYDDTLISLSKTSAVEKSTWVLVYPYTEPLITLKNKEKFSDVNMMNSENQKEILSFVTNRQCFGMEIQADTKKAFNLNKWQGTISQGPTNDLLTFSQGTGFFETRRHSAMNTNPYMPLGNPSKFFYFAHACTTKPIVLTADFAITLKPLYQQDLPPLQLEWKALKSESAKN